jgi:hypothetical protein
LARGQPQKMQPCRSTQGGQIYLPTKREYKSVPFLIPSHKAATDFWPAASRKRGRMRIVGRLAAGEPINLAMWK